MLCDSCHERDAVVHLTTIHLCTCAVEILRFFGVALTLPLHRARREGVTAATCMPALRFGST